MDATRDQTWDYLFIHIILSQEEAETQINLPFPGTVKICAIEGPRRAGDADGNQGAPGLGSKVKLLLVDNDSGMTINF